MTRSRRAWLTLAGAAAWACAAGAAAVQSGPAESRPAQAASAPAPPAHAAVLEQYCSTCHNERMKTGGFVIDPASVDDVGSSADVWEKVLRKVRAGDMPPGRSPRPEPAILESLTAFIETGRGLLIGVGLTENEKYNLQCVGNYFDASTPEKYNRLRVLVIACSGLTWDP